MFPEAGQMFKDKLLKVSGDISSQKVTFPLFLPFLPSLFA